MLYVFRRLPYIAQQNPSRTGDRVEWNILLKYGLRRFWEQEDITPRKKAGFSFRGNPVIPVLSKTAFKTGGNIRAPRNFNDVEKIDDDATSSDYDDRV